MDQATAESKEKEEKKAAGNEIRKASFFIGDDKDYHQPIKIVGDNGEEIQADEILVPPDGGWGWVIVIASFLSNVVVDGIILSFGLMAQPMRDSFKESGEDVSLSSIAWVSSLQNGFYLMGGPFVSALSNKFGFRVVAILGAILGSLGFLASWFFCMSKPSLYALFGFYGVVGGIGFNLLYVPSVIAVGFYFEKYRALGIAICGSGVGTFIMAPLTYTLINKIGWRLTLVVQAGLILSCSVCGAMYRPVKPIVKRSDHRKQQLRKKSSLTPFPSPAGTPLLMRIKKAREMEKWDSVNSVEADSELRPINSSSAATARKASTQSLNNPLPLHKQSKRMSVPTMAMPMMSGDIPMTIQRTSTAASVRKNIVSGDLKGIEEQDEAEERDETGEPNNKVASTTTSNGSEPLKPVTSSTTISKTQKIGNSLLVIDEMTKSRILRVGSKAVINKPVYRDDIFYSGSMKRIPEYVENVETGGLASYEWNAVVASKPPPSNKRKNFLSKLSVLRKMLDFSLILSPTFLLLAVSGFLTMLGFFVPFIYLKGIAMQNGVAESNAPILISVIGIANTVGRILCGWVADRPKVNAVYVNNAALTLGGFATCFVPFLNTYYLFIIYSLIFGLAIACFASLRSILLVELLGLNKLTNAFGLLCLFQGVAAMIGSPLAGWLFDTTGAYDYTFYCAGSFLLLSGILCYPIQCINRWERNKERSKNKV